MAEPSTIINITGNQMKAVGAGIKLNEIRGAIDELEALCKMKVDAADQFNDACKLVALKSGLETTVVSSYITARVNETLSKKQKVAEQLALLFDEFA